MVIALVAEIVRYAVMADPLKDPAQMSDDELRREWHCIDCDTENLVRTEELAREMEKRHLDF